MTIDFLVHLISSYLDLGSIYNDAFVAHVKAVLTVARLVLPADKNSDHLSHAPERYFLSIKEVPCLTLIMHGNICGLWGLAGHNTIHVSVEKVIGHLHGSVTNVGIELELSELGLGLESLGYFRWQSLLGNRVSLLIAKE